ncbi:MAG: hypothetical protein QOI31_1988 [Solirubrobacterales bacterium]|jgi:hypothetical protein|nr:hypothetical protein [Solirubrobacterales bacterium]
MSSGRVCALVLAFGLVAPATAGAAVYTYRVHTTSGSDALDTCTNAPTDCSLPGAVELAEEGPVTTKAEEKKVKGEGIVDATVFVYKTQSGKNVPPTGLKKLIGTTTVDGNGE